MENLVFDNGIKRYRVNNEGELAFNPSDPNVYGRFMDAIDKISSVENEMVEKGKNIKKDDGEAVVRMMVDADRKVKTILQEVFGRNNDFDAIFGSVNIMAVASNGERVITNFINALMPIVAAGAEQCATQKISTAVAEADSRRAQRMGTV